MSIDGLHSAWSEQQIDLSKRNAKNRLNFAGGDFDWSRNVKICNILSFLTHPKKIMDLHWFNVNTVVLLLGVFLLNYELITIDFFFFSTWFNLIWSKKIFSLFSLHVKYVQRHIDSTCCRPFGTECAWLTSIGVKWSFYWYQTGWPMVCYVLCTVVCTL